jgi:hypothetical protein
MTLNAKTINNVEIYLRQKKYIISKEKTPKWFSYSPNIIAKKDNDTLGIYIREGNSMPEVLIQRISSSSSIKRKVKFEIIFLKKPNSTTIQLLNLYGLGIGYIVKAKVKEIQTIKPVLTKKISKNKGPQHKKMPTTEIFISSHQDIEERQEAKKLIEEFFPTHKIPFSPVLVEDDFSFTFSETKKCIDHNLNISELFLGILAEQYRPWVSKEIKKIFKMRNPNEIIIFIKSNKKTKTNWKNLTSWIIKQKNVKYFEYVDTTEFKRKLNHCLMLKAKKIHQELKIPFMLH